MTQKTQSALVDPVEVVSSVKRELRKLSVEFKELSPVLLSLAMRLEQAELSME